MFERLINKLDQFANGKYYFDERGNMHEGLSLDKFDCEQLKVILIHFVEIAKIIDEYNSTRDSSPMVERAYTESTKNEKVECFERILDTFNGRD